MSSLLNLSIRVDKLPREKFVMGKDGAVYFNFTVAVNDDANQFGQNVSAYDSQTKEERDAKKAKNYLGNGNVVWTDGNIKAVKKEGQPATQQASSLVDDSLPF
jgi:hypothetical protein